MYSTKSGTSLDRQILTWLDRAAALQKLTRYFSEKVRETGSVSSMSTLFSGLSMEVWLLRVTEPLPMSPLQENLTPSLEASMPTGQGKKKEKKHVSS